MDYVAFTKFTFLEFANSVFLQFDNHEQKRKRCVLVTPTAAMEG